MPVRFKYEKLADSPKEPEVRYLSITSGSSPVIQCTLSNETLTSGHICLSHRWYEKARTREIIVNGIPFAVSENLWHFLNVARSKYEAEARFWIDAICINQGDIAEKNRQVPLMGQIYSNAKLVVSWLGSGDAQMRLCVQAIKKCELKLHANHFHRAIAARNDDFWANYWDHITRFFENEYWSRIWVVQEVLLANSGYLLLGDQELNWQELTNYWRLITQPEILPQTHSVRLLAWGKTWHRTPEQSTLRTLLQQWGKQLCNDPHDRVYALRALAEDGDRIKVNYNLSREQLLFDTLIACGSEKCFCLAGHLVKILRLNDRKASAYAHIPQSQRQGLWKWTEEGTKHDIEPFISFGINEADLLYLTGEPRNHQDVACLRSLPKVWRQGQNGVIVRFFYTPVPADVLVRYNDSPEEGAIGWYVAGLRFHQDRVWTGHAETFPSKGRAPGITVHTDVMGDLCCLRITRTALLKILQFGEQHTMCDHLSFGGYEILDPESGVLRCGKSMTKGLAPAVVADRRRNPFRQPSACSTPRPMTPRTPSISPQLSRHSSQQEKAEVTTTTVVLTGWSLVVRRGR